MTTNGDHGRTWHADAPVAAVGNCCCQGPRLSARGPRADRDAGGRVAVVAEVDRLTAELVRHLDDEAPLILLLE